MEEDKEIPIILGRPFLAIGRAMIDVQRGELKLRVQEEEVNVHVFKAVRHLAESDTCFMAEMVEAIVSSQSGLTDPLETSLVENESDNLSEEAKEYVKWMDSFGHNRRKYFESLGEGIKTPVPSIEQPPKMEQKPLPSQLKYAYLGVESTLPRDHLSIFDYTRGREIIESPSRSQTCTQMVSSRSKRDSPFLCACIVFY